MKTEYIYEIKEGEEKSFILDDEETSEEIRDSYAISEIAEIENCMEKDVIILEVLEEDFNIKEMLYKKAEEQGYGDDARAVIRLFSEIIGLNGLKGLREEIDFILKYEGGKRK